MHNFRITFTIPRCKFSIFMTLAMHITEEVVREFTIRKKQ